MERDSESGLDHTQFRQYGSTMGRWMSPDPYNGSMDLSNPQSFNRYSYVLNSPLSLTDPSGLEGGAAAPACWAAVAQGGANPVADAGCGFFLAADALIGDLLSGLFSHPTFHGSLTPRPSTGNPNWDGNFGESLGLPVNGPAFGGGGLFGSSSGCEFGSCGNSFSPQDPNNSQSDGISSVINFSVGWHAFWGGFSHSAGCVLVGGGTGLQSFLGLPSAVDNGPPSASAVVGAARGAYKIGTPGMMYSLGKAGPLGRLAGDAIPIGGEFLLYAQGSLAVHDGGKAFYDCSSK